MQKELDAIALDATNRLLAAPMACKEAKEAAKGYLAARGTPKEREALIAFLRELSEDITSIGDLETFAKSREAKSEFGEEGAKAFLAHVEELKKSGALFCDCPACKAAEDLLDLRRELLK
ncbi:MAG: hypothetical protein BWY98_00441 [Tenericutes bacterium ADurb.BinA155]|jgi:hypothetical protein|nr:MAG: hypothetical protein BWY98_00441 [Tenericutes bacterium ADurb.BinA155]